jgi:hypothetical protein
MPQTVLRGDRKLFRALLAVGLTVNFVFALAGWTGQLDVWTPQLGILLYLLLLLMWVYLDAKQRPEIFRPFDFGLILFLFWYLYLPYYFVKTRGASGLAMLLGLVALPYLVFIVAVAAAALDEFIRPGVFPP